MQNVNAMQICATLLYCSVSAQLQSVVVLVLSANQLTVTALEPGRTISKQSFHYHQFNDTSRGTPAIGLCGHSQTPIPKGLLLRLVKLLLKLERRIETESSYNEVTKCL